MAQNYYPTAKGLIDVALGHIRAVDPDGTLTPTTTQEANALLIFNQLVTMLQAKGMQVWCIKSGTLTLTALQNSYTLGPSGNLNIQRPTSVNQAYLHNASANTDPVPIRIIGREEFMNYTSKASTSTPNSIFYDRQYELPTSNSGANAKGLLWVYPTPDTTAASTYTMTLWYTRPIQDFSATSDSLDFPPEWFAPLTWTLAHWLCPSYGVPVMYWDRIKAVAQECMELVSGWDAETDSMQVYPAGPNTR